MNKENGNNTLTQAHIQHPIVEIYDAIEAQVAAVDGNHNTLLFNSLNQLSKNADNSAWPSLRNKPMVSIRY